jgi:hypothetical protein
MSIATDSIPMTDEVSLPATVSSFLRTAARATCIAALGIALVISLARADHAYADSTAPWKSLGLLAFICYCPLLLQSFLSRQTEQGTRQQSWWSYQSTLVVLAIIVVGLFGWKFPAAGTLLCIMGGLIFLVDLAGSFWTQPMRKPLFQLILLLIIGTFLGLSNWSYTLHFWNPRELIGQGKMMDDSLFHMALGNMLKTYGAPSTGLDGLPYYPYHWGSHAYFAQIARLLNITMPDMYHVAYMIIIVPLFVFGALIAAIDLRRWLVKSSDDFLFPLLSNRLLLPALGIGLIGLFQWIPANLLEIRPVCKPFVFESEVFSLILMLLSISPCISFLYGLSEGNKPISFAVAGSLYFGAMSGIMTLCKISTGATIIPVLLVAYLQFGLWRRWQVWLPVIVVACTMLISLRLTYSPHSHGSGLAIRPLAYFGNTPWWFLPLSLAEFYLWAFLLFWRGGVRENPPLRNLLITLLVTAALPEMILGFGQFNSPSHYFNHFGQVICWMMVLSLLSGPNAITLAVVGWKPYVRRSLVGLLLLCWLVTYAMQWKAAFAQELAARGIFRGQGYITRPEQPQQYQKYWEYVRHGDIGSILTLLKQGEQNVQKQITDDEWLPLLEELYRLPDSEKAASLLYIPSETSRYWHSYGFEEPGQVPTPLAFVAPAVSGMATVGSIYHYPVAFLKDKAYSWEIYNAKQPDWWNSPLEERLKALRAEAGRMGYRYLYVLLQNEQGRLRYERLDCP